ncbi:MAG TPA: hypothetical protein VG053_06335 [Solirubrobacteraceae bacterium]|nr:hypothetical protein [Solirubrobacteraceae bacterium]
MLLAGALGQTLVCLGDRAVDEVVVVENVPEPLGDCVLEALGG